MTFRDPSPNQFYRLTLSEAISHYWYGMINASGLLYYAVKIYRRDGHAFRINNIPAFCNKLGITQRAFYKAKAALVSTGFLEEEIYGAVGLKSVPLYDEQSFSENEQSFSENEQSFSENEQSFSENEQSFTTSHPKSPKNKDRSDLPDITDITDVKQTLSDPKEAEATLTVESTKIIDSEEREKKNESEGEKDLSVDAQSDRKECKHRTADSTDFIGARQPRPPVLPNASRLEWRLAKEVRKARERGQKETSRPSLKNPPSKKKGCDGLCSIEEILGDTLLPRTREELKKTYQFGDEECEEFEEFTKNKASQYREKVVVLDDWAMAKLKSLLAEYASWKRQKIAIERRRAEIEKQSHSDSREPVAQEPPSEPENPDKPKKTMKEIAAEIRRKRDEKLLAENPKEYKRRMKWRNL